jgi:glycosyltransferase involved in cell wall biosynthesis
MRVLVDTTYRRRAPLSGTGIYVARICAELEKLNGVEVIEAANGRREPPAGGGVGSARNLANDLRWSAAELPRLARRAGAEVIHHPLPARSVMTRAPQVVTVVDLAFERLPDHFDRGFRTYAHYAHRAAARAADAVICISETTARDVQELWGIAREKICVAPLGPGQDFAADPRDAQPDRAFSHFLYVGDDEPRKDLPTLLDAYRRYRDRVSEPLGLVLAGSASATQPGVRTVEHPDGADLHELYLGAAALVHTSLYEGFGLTPVEAMTVGTPVLAARVPGVREVCADAARYAEPGDAEGFADAMVQLAHDPAIRDDLARRGRARAAEFSWARCASIHLDAYSLASRPR